jgi:hypothetical protein
MASAFTIESEIFATLFVKKKPVPPASSRQAIDITAFKSNLDLIFIMKILARSHFFPRLTSP